jgi:GT2 family glycosyltransferase
MTAASVVIVTMGGRTGALAAAVESVRAQSTDAELVVVGNGCAPQVEAATVVLSVENVGVAAGRNLGWRRAGGDIVLFLDDDARYAGTKVVGEVVRRFEADPTLAVLSLRIVDEAGRVSRKHVPMLAKRDTGRVVDVTTFLGGACAIRRSVLAGLGGYPDDFFYALEETDLAWRVLDGGGRIGYAGDLEVVHPAVPTHLREGALYNTARNRVVLARRRLPRLLVPVYLAVRGLLSLGNARRWADLKSLAGGYRAGFRATVTDRQPMRWKTVWRMTRLGRPPIV